VTVRPLALAAALAGAAAGTALSLAPAAAQRAPARPDPARPDPAQRDPDRAKAAAHFKQGNAYFQLEDYDRALAEYQASFDLSGEPSQIFNIALCHDRAHRLEQALETFRRYLELAPDGAVADEARENIARLTPIVERIAAERAAEQVRLRDEAERAAERSRPPPPPPPERPSVAARVVVLAGGLGVLAGATAHVLAWRARDRVADAPDLDAYHTERETFESRRTLAIGAYAAGSLTIAAGLVLGWTVLRTTDGPQLSAQVTPDGAALAVRWSR
jgi:tetratricopeptide (TPR) repeat protein